MSDINQVKNSIKEELEKGEPSKKKVLSYLFKRQLVSYSEFFDIVRDTFKLNPEFYMKELYKVVRKRTRKLYGVDKLKEMEKTIIEQFCLYDGEQILLEFNGQVEFNLKPILKSRKVLAGESLYITNHRIITQGRIMAIETTLVDGRKPWGFSPPEKIARKRIMNYSRQEKCYGYIFPIRDLSKLGLTPKGVQYNVVTSMYYEGESKSKLIRIRVAKSMANREEIVNQLFEILSREGTNIQ